MNWRKCVNIELVVAISIIVISFFIAAAILLIHSNFTLNGTDNNKYIEDRSEKWVPPFSVEAGSNYQKKEDEIKFIDTEPPEYLTYATTTKWPRGGPEEDFYFGEDNQNNLILLHYKQKNYKATSTYPVYRIYPGNLSREQIIADLKLEDGSGFPHWYGFQPVSLSANPKTGMASENLIRDIYTRDQIIPDWLEIPAGCIGYRGGDSCSFTIKPLNPYGLTPATLMQKTGPFEWGKHLNPQEIYVTTDNKILIKWVFGDGGMREEIYTLWDVDNSNHVRVSDVSSMYRESIQLSIPQKIYTYAYNDTGYETTSDILKVNPFFGINIYNQPLRENCHDVYFHPTNPTDITAKWIIEYTYGCPGEMIRGLSVWYELDPVTDTVRALTSIIPK